MTSNRADEMEGIAQQLLAVHVLEEQLDTTQLQGLSGQGAATAELVPTVVAQAEAVRRNGENLERFIEVYNDVVAGMSATFVDLDSRLRKLEASKAAS